MMQRRWISHTTCMLMPCSRTRRVVVTQLPRLRLVSTMALEEMAISTLSSPSAIPSRTVVCSMMRLSAPNWASIWPALTMIRVISVCCSRDSSLPGVMLLMIPLSVSKMEYAEILPQT